MDTLNRNFAEFLDKGRANGKTRLRQLQWQAAQKGNVTMLIWLGKTMLGRREPEPIRETESSAVGFEWPDEKEHARLTIA